MARVRLFRSCCYAWEHGCTDSCGCPPDTCGSNFRQELPAVDVKESLIPGAGRGAFVAQNYKKGQWIAVLPGQVIRHRGVWSHNSFEIAQDHAIEVPPEGIWFLNEAESRESMNCSTRYMEGPNRREVIMFAKQDIAMGDELTGSYTTNGSLRFAKEQKKPRKADYVLVRMELGEDDDKTEFELTGKVLEVLPRKGGKETKFNVQWYLPKKFIPSVYGIRPGLKKVDLDDLKPGEHLMAEDWMEPITQAMIARIIFLSEGGPVADAELHDNSFWYARSVNMETGELSVAD
ncbi:hypothetical protein BDV95DRAFT_610892 [Massariosphaeria phaeospora]|uniref:SET domain-containing protein n=1 Tax=Massariosphaeria phaeospora TaxID=100035 RepID=A0A7C8MEG9_9PLEO|nr:hypothetical protein BDV95DRAFT_610892 [Massariosphaeria phaeospora]